NCCVDDNNFPQGPELGKNFFSGFFHPIRASCQHWWRTSVPGGVGPALATGAGKLYTSLMQLTYNIREAQAQLSKLCRGGRKFVIANRDKPVFVALPVADFEALLETMDVLADPQAMKALKQSRGGSTKYATLNLDDENFGL
ncbi:MAG: type II toxin-antitoxin system Phd/YefM family antitoxin, partial [Terrimicrobiaceae bacterium]